MSQTEQTGATGRAGAAGGDESTPLVVGVGIAAGGLEPLRSLLESVGEGDGMCLVVVPRADPPEDSKPAPLLEGRFSLPVDVVEREAPVRAGRVLLAPADAEVTLEGGVVRIGPRPRGPGCSTIDGFLRSLAGEAEGACVGVVLSGGGSDGTLGLKAVSEAGGMTIAQDPSTAAFEGMPRSAIATGVVDHVLAPDAMGRELVAFSKHVREVAGRGRGGDAQREDIARHVEAIAKVLRERRDHEFKHYRTTTLVRRIQRRMQVLREPTAAGYLRRLEESEEETSALFRELLIGVTEFFRDPGAFEALGRRVVSKLVERVEPGESIRVWCPGCATGEEAYSLAMLFHEEMERSEARAGLQVFATDIDERALALARRGSYPLSAAEKIPPDRLQRFFVRKGGRLHVRGELRESVLFSVHNLIGDPPFSRMDLVSCRNLLIYFGAHLQKKLVPLFHYALRPGGYLFLGPSESIESHAELFVPVDLRHRISQRRQSGAEQRRPPAVEGRRPAGPPLALPTEPEPDLGQISQRIVLDEFCPAYAVVSEDNRVVYLAPGVGRFLEPPSGTFDSNLVRMARDGLRIGLRATLAESTRTRRRARRENLSLREEGRVRPVTVTVQPMPSLGEDRSLFLVVFEERAAALPSPSSAEGSGEAEGVIAQLEAELTGTRDDLESAVQELEAANEELKSSNEELLSMNEELQAANEELETSKEELEAQSAALARAHTDIENLLASTRIATIFLDQRLRINSFTGAAREIYNLIDSDVGRPLSDITHRAERMPPLPEASSVAGGEAPLEHEVALADGRWFRRRVLPYRDAQGASDGVVVTFVEVTALKEGERALRESETRMRSVADSLPVLIAHCDAQERYIFCNREYERWFGLEREGVIGRTVREVVGDRAYEQLREPIAAALAGRRLSMEGRLPYERGRERDVLVEYVPDLGEGGEVRGYYALIQDVTERKRSERRLAAEHAVTRALADSASMEEAAPRVVEVFCEAKALAACELWLPDGAGGSLRRAAVASDRGEDGALSRFVEGAAERRYGRGEGLVGRVWERGRVELVDDASGDESFERREAAERAGVVAGAAFPILWGEECLGVVQYFAREPLKYDGEMMEMVESIGRDIGQFMGRERAEQARRESESRFRTMADAAPVLVWMAGNGGGCTWFNRGWLEFTGRPMEAELGEGWTRGVHPDDFDRCVETYRAAFERREPFRLEYRLRHHSGAYRWILDDGHPLLTPSGEFAGYIGACIDIHDRKQAEDSTRLLAEAGAALADSLDMEQTLATVADVLVPRLADWCVVDLYGDSGELELAAVRHREPEKMRLARELRTDYGVAEGSPLRRVLESGEPMLLAEVSDEDLQRAATSEEHLRRLRSLDLRSGLIVPLRVGGRTLGGMTLVASGGRRFGESDLPLAEDVARRCAASIENSRLYREVQRALRERGEALEMHRAMEQRLGVLVEASSELLARPGLDETLEGILGVAHKLIDADACAVWRYVQDADEWRIVSGQGLSARFLELSPVPGGGDVHLPHDPIVVEAEAIEEGSDDLLGHRFELYRREGIRSLLICPMRIRGRATGTIVFYYQRTHRFGDIEVRAATALANFAGAALTNAELFEAAEREIGERERAEGEAAARAAQQEAVAELGQLAVREGDLGTVFDAACRTVARTLGDEYCKVLELLPGGERMLLRAGVGWHEGLVGEGTVDTGTNSQAGYTLRAERPVIVDDLREETRFRGPSLLVEHGVISGMSCIIAGEGGRPWGVLGTHATRRREFTRDDVNFLQAVANVLSAAIQHRASERALRESERRLRAVTETVPDIVWSAGAAMEWTYVNPRFEATTGMDPERALGRGWLEAVHREDRARVERGIDRAVASGEPFESELRLRAREGTHRWFVARAQPIRDDAGELRHWFGTCTDVDDIKRAKEQNDLLVGELNHRVKNTMATVLSISDQTARSAPSLEVFKPAFEGRMSALSHAHGLLSQTRWRGARLRALLDEVIEPFSDHDPQRVRLEGPEVTISPRAALTLTLAIHELATNAAKYGALSVPGGSVDIEWRLEPGDPPTLVLEWVERGGPSVKPPPKRGFGSRLLERSVAYELGGDVALEYAPEGVRCRVTVPVHEGAAGSDG